MYQECDNYTYGQGWIATISGCTMTGTTPGQNNFSVLTLQKTGGCTACNNPLIFIWNNPAAITYGTALSSNQLNATASVLGSFTYNPTNGTVLKAGINTLSTIFTPTDTVDFTSVTNSVSLVVVPATPLLTWANPTPIYYGTALSSNQLDATAN